MERPDEGTEGAGKGVALSPSRVALAVAVLSGLIVASLSMIAVLLGSRGVAPFEGLARIAFFPAALAALAAAVGLVERWSRRTRVLVALLVIEVGAAAVAGLTFKIPGLGLVVATVVGVPVFATVAVVSGASPRRVKVLATVLLLVVPSMSYVAWGALAAIRLRTLAKQVQLEGLEAARDLPWVAARPVRSDAAPLDEDAVTVYRRLLAARPAVHDDQLGFLSTIAWVVPGTPLTIATPEEKAALDAFGPKYRGELERAARSRRCDWPGPRFSAEERNEFDGEYVREDVGILLEGLVLEGLRRAAANDRRGARACFYDAARVSADVERLDDWISAVRSLAWLAAVDPTTSTDGDARDLDALVPVTPTMAAETIGASHSALRAYANDGATLGPRPVFMPFFRYLHKRKDPWIELLKPCSVSVLQNWAELASTHRLTIELGASVKPGEREELRERIAVENNAMAAKTPFGAFGFPFGSREHKNVFARAWLAVARGAMALHRSGGKPTTLPDDPFAEPRAPLRFTRLPTGGWRVWSTGPNGADDGGVYPPTMPSQDDLVVERP